jgi:predicted DNA-binding protein
MPKKIISFALSEEAIKKMDNTSKALGMSRSEYIDMMIKKGFHFSDEVEEISKLQEKIKEKINGEKEQK